jgi:hypothetical protein
MLFAVFGARLLLLFISHSRATNSKLFAAALPCLFTIFPRLRGRKRLDYPGHWNNPFRKKRIWGKRLFAGGKSKDI